MVNTRKRIREEDAVNQIANSTPLKKPQIRLSTMEIKSEQESTPIEKKAVLPDNKKPVNRGISEFEQKRQENMKANAAFLASLNIGQAKRSLSETVNDVKEKRKASNRGIKNEYTKIIPIERDPISLRPRSTLKQTTRLDISDQTENTSARSRRTIRSVRTIPSVNGVKAIAELEYDKPEQYTDEYLTFEECCKNKESTDLEAFKTVYSNAKLPVYRKDQRDFSEFLSDFETLKIAENQVAKVTPKRITALSVHEVVEDKPLIAAGDKSGFLGLWDILSTSNENRNSTNDGVTLFQPHTAYINCVKFSPYNPHYIYTSGYDGRLRRGDLIQQQFQLLHSTPVGHDNGLTYISLPDENTTVVCQKDCSVTYVDHRCDTLQHSNYVLNHSAGRLKCLSHHPIASHYFIVSSQKGSVELYDDRALSTNLKDKNKFVTSVNFRRSVTSAYFSPTSGDKILTCSLDDRIRIIDSSDLTNLTEIKSISHDNFTGRWLSTFRAQWHPHREDTFLMGAMKHPRQIEMFNANGSIVHRFMDDEEYLASICCLNIYHPTRNMVIGGNASGRVHVFM